jgi:adenosine deaminase
MTGYLPHSDALKRLANKLPKTELHLHIEGSLEPELLFELAQRNNITLTYADVAEVRAAYQFSDLQSFLDIYYAGAAVLITEQDFFDLTRAYLERADADNVVHVEIFFDPQTHTERGVDIGVVIAGLRRGLLWGEATFGITNKLIMCFLRHLEEQDAFTVWEQALPYLQEIDGVGLDSGERGNPPEKFKNIYAAVREAGLPVVAHAGEEGPAEYVRSAVDVLKVSRIDHGVRCIEDPLLVAELAEARMPLTVCPLSNQKLQVYPDLADHTLKFLLDKGLCVMVNSDDPAYFGGYVNANFDACIEALPLTEMDIRQLAKNSFEASWLPESVKADYISQIETLQI